MWQGGATNCSNPIAKVQVNASSLSLSPLRGRRGKGVGEDIIVTGEARLKPVVFKKNR
jgi:hypothetical protein